MKKHLGYRLIYDDHSIANARKTGLTGWLFYRLFPFGRVLREGDRLIGIADQSVQFIRELYRFPADAVEKVPLGADTQLFRFDSSARESFRREHRIDDLEIVVGYTGKLTEAKGPHELLEAIGIIAASIEQPLTALLVGNMAESYRSTLARARRKLGGRAKVIMLPAMDNRRLPEVYSACDICVWPKQASIAIIEAISAARPVICPAFLTDCLAAGNGIGLDRHGPEELAEAILSLARDPDLRHTMGRRGRTMVERELSWSNIAERFVA
jgi:glycosyltransferase involved in cell wall biosynthesis